MDEAGTGKILVLRTEKQYVSVDRKCTKKFQGLKGEHSSPREVQRWVLLVGAK